MDEKQERDLVVISGEEIDHIFASATHQFDYVVGLYKRLFPDWDAIELIDGYPACNDAFWKRISLKAQKFDEIHHPKVLPGGAWMNKGFTIEDDVPDWHVDRSTCEVIYKKGAETPIE